ncbi:MAG: septum formation initiator family protein [Gemmatimonadetes bacterium]|nr:septum formation initiator family protein [Gemmatimonadota bacterium]
MKLVKRIRWLLLLIILGGAGYFALFGGEYSLFESRAVKKQKATELAQLRMLGDSIGQLQARVDSLASDPGMLERVAREFFGLVKKGERLYRFVGLGPEKRDTLKAKAERAAQVMADSMAAHAERAAQQQAQQQGSNRPPQP